MGIMRLLAVGSEDVAIERHFAERKNEVVEEMLNCRRSCHYCKLRAEEKRTGVDGNIVQLKLHRACDIINRVDLVVHAPVDSKNMDPGAVERHGLGSVLLGVQTNIAGQRADAIRLTNPRNKNIDRFVAMQCALLGTGNSKRELRYIRSSNSGRDTHMWVVPLMMSPFHETDIANPDTGSLTVDVELPPPLAPEIRVELYGHEHHLDTDQRRKIVNGSYEFLTTRTQCLLDEPTEGVFIPSAGINRVKSPGINRVKLPWNHVATDIFLLGIGKNYRMVGDVTLFFNGCIDVQIPVEMLRYYNAMRGVKEELLNDGCMAIFLSDEPRGAKYGPFSPKVNFNRIDEVVLTFKLEKIHSTQDQDQDEEDEGTIDVYSHAIHPLKHGVQMTYEYVFK